MRQLRSSLPPPSEQLREMSLETKPDRLHERCDQNTGYACYFMINGKLPTYLFGGNSDQKTKTKLLDNLNADRVFVVSYPVVCRSKELPPVDEANDKKGQLVA